MILMIMMINSDTIINTQTYTFVLKLETTWHELNYVACLHVDIYLKRKKLNHRIAFVTRLSN